MKKFFFRYCIGMVGILIMFNGSSTGLAAEDNRLLRNPNNSEQFDVVADEKSVNNFDIIDNLGNEISIDELREDASKVTSLPPSQNNLFNPTNSASTYDIFGRDDRILVKNNTSFPYSTITYISVVFPNGEHTVSTGSLIGPTTVLTSGHSIYDNTRGGFAKSVEVIPGYDGINRPFGTFTHKSLDTTRGWKNSNNNYSNKYDIGVIKLSKSPNVGHLGMTQHLPSNNRMTLTGYHADKPAKMHTQSGPIYKKTDSHIDYLHDTKDGSSGSPIYNSQGYVFAVNTGSDKRSNFAPRLTNDNWTLAYNWATNNSYTAKKYDKKVTIKSPNYNIWRNFNWSATTGHTKDRFGQVFDAKYYYIVNNIKYYSLYQQGKWIGYLNAGAVNDLNAVKFGKNVTVNNKNYNIWGNLNFSNTTGHTKNNFAGVFEARYTYTLGNGAKYYSLYKSGKWVGYLNAAAAYELKAVPFNKNVKITSPNYSIWRNLYFNATTGHTKNYNGKTLKAKYVYTIGNGTKYYSLYDSNNIWIGYLNTAATNMK